MTDDSGTRYDQKNEEKFTLLFEMYGKAMRRKAYAILRDRDWAEDAVQIAFEKVTVTSTTLRIHIVIVQKAI